MGLIEAGHRLVNSAFIIMTERGDGTAKTDLRSGVVRVTVLPGQSFDLDGDEAERFMVELAAERKCEPFGPASQPIYGRSANPPSEVPAVPARKRRVRPR